MCSSGIAKDLRLFGSELDCRAKLKNQCFDRGRQIGRQRYTRTSCDARGEVEEGRGFGLQIDLARAQDPGARGRTDRRGGRIDDGQMESTQPAAAGLAGSFVTIWRAAVRRSVSRLRPTIHQAI